jgi:Zn-dependent protease
MGTVTRMRRGGSVIKPSPVFLGVLGLAVLSGLATWRSGEIPGSWILFGNMDTFTTARIAVFVLVVTGWIVSLCLHEFGHAYLAYRSGDSSIVGKGYLSLDPLKYGDPIMSFFIPVLFVLLGGIGLPGGAVWIDRGAIRGGRWRHSLISAAGPLANLAFALALAVAVNNLWDAHQGYFWAALSFLTFLQVTAALLNILPIPGLDGFGIIEPYLPRSVVRQANEIGGYAFFGLLALLWLPPVNRAFFNGVYHITSALGVNSSAIAMGDTLFRFWTH